MTHARMNECIHVPTRMINFQLQADVSIAATYTVHRRLAAAPGASSDMLAHANDSATGLQQTAAARWAHAQI